MEVLEILIFTNWHILREKSQTFPTCGFGHDFWDGSTAWIWTKTLRRGGCKNLVLWRAKSGFFFSNDKKKKVATKGMPPHALLPISLHPLISPTLSLSITSPFKQPLVIHYHQQAQGQHTPAGPKSVATRTPWRWVTWHMGLRWGWVFATVNFRTIWAFFRLISATTRVLRAQVIWSIAWSPVVSLKNV